MNKTANGLVEYVKAQLGKPYWYGTFGQTASRSLYDQKKNQYPSYYKWDYAGEIAKVHDCVGLIKGYLWCDNAEDNTPTYNPAQDKSANMLRDACQTKGEMETMPDVPGVLVFMNRHVGVYIGNGEVIEARGHAYGVVKTKLNARAWTSWGYCPYVEYEVATTAPAPAKGTYTLEQFVREVQAAIGAKVDGKAGPETIGKTVTVSRYKNRTHAVVKPIQKWLYTLGYPEVGDADGKAGPKFEQAVKHYQKDHGRNVDGEITAKQITWRKLLGME